MIDTIPQEVLHDYQNRTIVSVENPRWDNAEHTSLTADVVFAELAPLGPMPFTTSDGADTVHGQEVWDRAFAGEFGTIAAFVASPVPIPSEANRRQILTALGIRGWISEAEAEAALTNGARPAAVEAIIAALPEEERFPARMKWAGFQTAYIDDPMVLALAAHEAKTPADIEALFILADSIE